MALDRSHYQCSGPPPTCRRRPARPSAETATPYSPTAENRSRTIRSSLNLDSARPRRPGRARPARAGPALLHAEPKDQFASNISESAAVKPRPQELLPPGLSGPSCDDPKRPCGQNSLECPCRSAPPETPEGSPANARSNDRIHSLFTMINNRRQPQGDTNSPGEPDSLLGEPNTRTGTPVGRIHFIRTRSTSRRSRLQLHRSQTGRLQA